MGRTASFSILLLAALAFVGIVVGVDLGVGRSAPPGETGREHDTGVVGSPASVAFPATDAARTEVEVVDEQGRAVGDARILERVRVAGRDGLRVIARSDGSGRAMVGGLAESSEPVALREDLGRSNSQPFARYAARCMRTDPPSRVRLVQWQLSGRAQGRVVDAEGHGGCGSPVEQLAHAATFTAVRRVA